jgi:hypothetical protein
MEGTVDDFESSGGAENFKTNLASGLGLDTS